MAVLPGNLADEFLEEFLLAHVILESFPTVDENDRHFVIKLPAEFAVGVHVNFAPGEATSAGKFGEALLYHLTEMASFARVHDDVPTFLHPGGF